MELEVDVEVEVDVDVDVEVDDDVVVHVNWSANSGENSAMMFSVMRAQSQ